MFVTQSNSPKSSKKSSIDFSPLNFTSNSKLTSESPVVGFAIRFVQIPIVGIILFPSFIVPILSFFVNKSFGYRFFVCSFWEKIQMTLILLLIIWWVRSLRIKSESIPCTLRKMRQVFVLSKGTFCSFSQQHTRNLAVVCEFQWNKNKVIIILIVEYMNEIKLFFW